MPTPLINNTPLRPSVEELQYWVQGLGTEPVKTHLTLVANKEERFKIYARIQDESPFRVWVDTSARCNSWVWEPVVKNVTSRIDCAPVIQSLVDSSNIKIEPALQELVDTGDKHLSSLFKTLWDVRDGINDVAGLLKASFKIDASTEERYNSVLFWLILGHQNNLLDRVVLPMDGAMNRLPGKQEELLEFLTIAEKWARIGSPLGIVFGTSTTEGLRKRFWV